ncbi:putative poly(A)-specific ribonuclease [Helianthus annuus]|nr:putative poly(A)-specific ribonuclease [Helianthus annuus]
MDIEFSGVVLHPGGNFINGSDYHYQTLKDNFDVLKFTDDLLLRKTMKTESMRVDLVKLLISS